MDIKNSQLGITITRNLKACNSRLENAAILIGEKSKFHEKKAQKVDFRKLLDPF